MGEVTPAGLHDHADAVDRPRDQAANYDHDDSRVPLQNTWGVRSIVKNQTKTTSDTEKNKWAEIYEAEKGIKPLSDLRAVRD